jgi:hypothetical protein
MSGVLRDVLKDVRKGVLKDVPRNRVLSATVRI